MEMLNGTWCAFEVKLGVHQADVAAASLIKLKKKMVAGGVLAPEYKEYEKILAWHTLSRELETGRRSGEENGLISAEEVFRTIS